MTTLPDVMTAEEYRAWSQPKRSKYGNRKTTVDGLRFDSQAEAHRYGELRLAQQAGLINGLLTHPRFVVIPAFVDSHGQRVQATVYIADFSYYEPGNCKLVVEDVKGGKATQTAVFKLKWKLLQHLNPQFDCRIIDGKDGACYERLTSKPAKSTRSRRANSLPSTAAKRSSKKGTKPSSKSARRSSKSGTKNSTGRSMTRSPNTSKAGGTSAAQGRTS